MTNLIDSIYDVIMEMWENTGYSKFSTNETSIKDLIKDRIEYGFVYFDGKCLMLGNVYSPWFSDDLCASDTLLYTRKEFRGQGLAKKAVSDFINYAKESGAKHITLGQTTGVNELEFDKMAESLGLTKIGAVYNV